MALEIKRAYRHLKAARGNLEIEVAHLTDMEELLAEIPGAEIRDYMREAMSCYMAGAYRGSMVLSYIALFDDLLVKLGELGNVNSVAKLIYTEASKKRADQDVYESYLIDQLTSKKLISGLDSSFLITLRNLRNKSAHPSGHKPSPEEARFIFFETIDRFLSKPILSTTGLVDEIVGRLKNSNFFPSSSISDIRNVVREEIESLHDEAVPQLIAKTSACVISGDSYVKRNSSFFLIGLASLDLPSVNGIIQEKLIKAKADDDSYHDLITQVMSANGKTIVGVAGAHMERVRAILANKISSIPASLSEANLSHPTAALSAIAAALPESSFVSIFKKEIDLLFAKRARSEFVVKLVRDRPSLRLSYFNVLKEGAGSSDFNTANSFVSAIEALDGLLGDVLTDEQALMIIAATMKAASWGAWSAKGSVNAKFAGSPTLRSKAIAFINADEEKAAALIEEQLGEPEEMAGFVAAYLTDEAGS